MDNKTQKQNEGKAIVLNRMYAGNYLSTNLGHEVINMFQADNNKHYLYLNAKGNFSSKGKDVGIMLLVRGRGKARVEIVAMAKNLKHVESACCTLPRDIGKINEKVKDDQTEFLKGVTYGGKPIIDIFGEKGQQSVYVSYWVDKDNFFTPKKDFRLFIDFPTKDKKEIENDPGDVVISLEKHNFASTSLRQYICDGNDLVELTKLCENDKLWDVKNEKINLKEYNYGDKNEISLFDICQIQNDENRFSNALSYFIQLYPSLWKEILQECLKINDLGEIESVTREENAKVEKDEWKNKTGGRVDLLIRTKNFYIIIENKIDSGIIIDGSVSQLSRYYHYVKYLIEEQMNILINEKESIEKNKVRRYEQLKKQKSKTGKRSDKWSSEVEEFDLQLKEIENQINELKNRGVIGLVLTPNYNKPKTEQLKVKYEYKSGNKHDKFEYEFKNITYNDVYCKLQEKAAKELSEDTNLKHFYNAMKRLTYDYESDALYQDMLEKFVRRINEVKQ